MEEQLNQNFNQSIQAKLKKSKKNKTIIVMVAFVFICLFVAGFFISQYGKKSFNIGNEGAKKAAELNNNANDASNKIKIQEIKNAIENYYVTTGSYPKTLAELQEKTSAALGEGINLTAFTYSTTDPGSTYSISFILEDQQSNDENVTGAPPNKIYQIESSH